VLGFAIVVEKLLSSFSRWMGNEGHRAWDKSPVTFVHQVRESEPRHRDGGIFVYTLRAEIQPLETVYSFDYKCMENSIKTQAPRPAWIVPVHKYRFETMVVCSFVLSITVLL
jgi:hypothetical protein